MFRLSKKKYEELDIVPSCALCEFSSPTFRPEELLCQCRGIVASDYCCKKFRYDLLKRKPARALQKKSEEEPTLDNIALFPSLDDTEDNS